MQKSKSSNHFTWLFRHTKASLQKLTTKQRRWGWGRENKITLATLILVIIIEALLFFLFHPSAFPWDGQVSVSKKSRWSRVNLESRSHSVGDQIQGSIFREIKLSVTRNTCICGTAQLNIMGDKLLLNFGVKIN